MFRSDLVHHTAEPVNTLKRAITLFINVKQSDDMDAPMIKHNELTDTAKADALYVTMKIFSELEEKQLPHPSESDIADMIKTEFDKMHGGDENGLWHCIVGRDFGSSINPKEESFIYFVYKTYNILLFR
jgi:hypothetical protein